MDLLLDLPKEERTVSSSVNDFVRYMQERTANAYALAREHLRVAAERRRVSYDIKAKEVDFQIGDWVWYVYPRKYSSRCQVVIRYVIGTSVIYACLAYV